MWNFVNCVSWSFRDKHKNFFLQLLKTEAIFVFLVYKCGQFIEIKIKLETNLC